LVRGLSGTGKRFFRGGTEELIVNVALEVSYSRSYNCESFFETKNFCLNNTFLFLKLIKIVWDDLSTKNFRIFLSKGLFYEDHSSPITFLLLTILSCAHKQEERYFH
jgi:hypothetical protein